MVAEDVVEGIAADAVGVNKTGIPGDLVKSGGAFDVGHPSRGVGVGLIEHFGLKGFALITGRESHDFGANFSPLMRVRLQAHHRADDSRVVVSAK